MFEGSCFVEKPSPQTCKLILGRSSKLFEADEDQPDVPASFDAKREPDRDYLLFRCCSHI